ncbi:MAG: decaprenyl-phosphate phosphoribosyltransferase [Nitrospinae bacterium]|nr:decaprenyl-phosphate phosphoribosyltransferase [Nitrospinota bacterium]
MSLTSVVKLLRPSHWIKNILLFAPPFFGGSIFSAGVLKSSLPAFISFSFAASAIYIFNDIHDREADKNHPIKQRRPIASGEISAGASLIFSCILITLSILFSLFINTSFAYYIFSYLGLNILYTLRLRFLPIFDIFSISAGFIIRVMAGGEAFKVEVSNWLFLSVLFISILLASGKRLSEMSALKSNAHLHRKVLGEYPDGFLESLLWLTGAASLISYSLYTIEKGEDLFYTVILSAFGLIRYLYIVKMGKGEPVDAILGDRVLLTTIALWVITVGYLRYA